MIIRGTPLAIGKPFAVRPGTPPDRVAMLRDALAGGRRDPQFWPMRKRRRSRSSPPADEVTKDFAAMMGQPPEALEAMLKYIKLDSGG